MSRKRLNLSADEWTTIAAVLIVVLAVGMLVVAWRLRSG